jgi:nicotinate-nucleotide--dimethylbenzimidazole phosphoribosyltransferase
MTELIQQLQHKIDTKTKPLGALGRLEELALQIGTIQQSLSPTLSHPTIITFAADHGIANEGVSAFPQAVTPQMVLNFLNGGAAINVFCKQNNIAHHVVDTGVNYDFESPEGLINAKVAYGTQSFLTGKAMTEDQLATCFAQADTLVEEQAEHGCNVIGFGEMGIGNTSSAAMLMSAYCHLPLATCVGRGTGLNDEGLKHKLEILQEAQDFHGDISDPREILQTFGGFEIAHMTGGMMAAARRNMIVLVDGFIAGSACLAAERLMPQMRDNTIFCHCSDEAGHREMLQHMNANPILDLNMRLGEGSGCAVAYPLIESAVAFLNKMASFEDAGVAQSNDERLA